MSDKEFDVLVVGAGPGGYVAAIRAAQLDLKTAVVEREHLGGICLNWGCIPTKALLRSAEVLRTIKRAASFGLSVEDPGVDLKKIVERSRGVSAQLSRGVGHLLKKNKVTVIDGEAKLAGKGVVSVVKAGARIGEFAAKHIILATGARARTFPGLEEDGKLVWTYKRAMTPDTLPKSLLVVGSGAIGVEFASFYAELGTKVTIVEMLDRMLPVEDEEISALAKKRFEKRGIRVITSAKATIKSKTDNGVTATIEAGGKTEEATVDRVVVAVGVAANIENLGLEGTKAVIDRGHIVTDAFSRTAEPGLYAIGDLTAPPWLAHKASHEAVICVEKIAGLDPHPMDPRDIPGCTYSDPQVASVGLTEAKAAATGRKIRVGRFPFVGNGKAIALGEPEGLVKTIFDAETGELLGAHMIGAEVTEMIQGFVVGKTLETTEVDLMRAVFPHPTLSEMMRESVLDAFGRAPHI